MEYNFAEISQRIVDYRKKQKMSQERFIEELSYRGVRIARNRLSKIENGEKAAFDLDFLLACCEIFETDMGHLLGEYEAKTLDTDFICKTTGLSEKAVSDLISYNDYAPHINGVLSLLLENGMFRVIQEIYSYFDFYTAHEKEKETHRLESEKIMKRVRKSDFAGALTLANSAKTPDNVLESHTREVKALRLGIYESFIGVVDRIVKRQYEENRNAE